MVFRHAYLHPRNNTPTHSQAGTGMRDHDAPTCSTHLRHLKHHSHAVSGVGGSGMVWLEDENEGEEPEYGLG